MTHASHDDQLSWPEQLKSWANEDSQLATYNEINFAVSRLNRIRKVKVTETLSHRRKSANEEKLLIFPVNAAD